MKILLVFFNDVTEHNPPLGRSKQHYSIKRSKKTIAFKVDGPLIPT